MDLGVNVCQFFFSSLFFFLRWCGGVLLVGVVLACCLMFLVVTWAWEGWLVLHTGGRGRRVYLSLLLGI